MSWGLAALAVLGSGYVILSIYSMLPVTLLSDKATSVEVIGNIVVLDSSIRFSQTGDCVFISSVGTIRNNSAEITADDIYLQVRYLTRRQSSRCRGLQRVRLGSAARPGGSALDPRPRQQPGIGLRFSQGDGIVREGRPLHVASNSRTLGSFAWGRGGGGRREARRKRLRLVFSGYRKPRRRPNAFGTLAERLPRQTPSRPTVQNPLPPPRVSPDRAAVPLGYAPTSTQPGTLFDMGNTIALSRGTLF